MPLSFGKWGGEEHFACIMALWLNWIENATKLNKKEVRKRKIKKKLPKTKMEKKMLQKEKDVFESIFCCSRLLKQTDYFTQLPYFKL